ncbi:MAG: hypothetical protein KY467_08795 [Gemmatimonadetes bacterium]|nr:hypothetical protein [Gemmatimonadota bacterium]
MAEPERKEGGEDAGDWTDLSPEVKPIPPEYYGRPGGCGFTGCMYAAMIFAAIALVLLVIGLLTRVWMVPVVSPR